jgi:DNA-binding NtrC family response regulator
LKVEAIKRILVVDDEEEFVNTVKRHLKRERFTLHSAKDGEDACQKIDATTCDGSPYDLVITDVIMPKISGIELMQWIKHNHSHISVLVVSGFGGKHLVMESIRPELDDYCQKPLTPGEMMELIGNIDKKRRKCGCHKREKQSTALEKE